MKNTSGFTLIELMIVIAILGVLSSLAIPSYQDRVIRTQVQAGIDLADFVMQEVNDYYKKKKRMPKNNAALALPPENKIISNYVSSINVKGGALRITYGKRVNKYLLGKVLTIRPAIVKGYPKVPIAWVCGNASEADKMMVVGTNNTDIPAPHLPIDCRPG